MRRSTAILCAVLAIVPVLFCLGAIPVVLIVRGVVQDADRINQRAADLKNAPPAKPPVMTREQFREKVKAGMTPDEVLAAVGRPDETLEHTLETTWFYRGRTIDALTGKVGTAIVTFEKGKVAGITF